MQVRASNDYILEVYRGAQLLALVSNIRPEWGCSTPNALSRHATPLAAPFLEPVRWKEWGLFDYPKLIKHPMDLSTISVRVSTTGPRSNCRRRPRVTSILIFLMRCLRMICFACVFRLAQAKLEAGEYSSPLEYERDMNLVWDNCMTYNQVRSCFSRRQGA